MATKIDNLVRSSSGGKYPPFMLKALVDLDDFLKHQHEDKEAKKKLNALNAKALTAMKQKLRKFMKNYEQAIEEWRKNPVADEETVEEGSTEESESESEAETAPKKPAAAKHAFMKKSKFLKQAESSSEESEEEETQSEDESSSSEDEKGANRWRKSTATAAATAKKSAQKQKPAVAAAKSAAATSETDEEFTTVARGKKQQQKKAVAAEPQVTPQNLNEKLREILEARGKKVFYFNPGILIGITIILNYRELIVLNK
jgi:translation initiation factor 3 subunit C